MTGLFDFNPKWAEHSNNVEFDRTAKFGWSKVIISSLAHNHINTHLKETMSQMSSAFKMLPSFCHSSMTLSLFLWVNWWNRHQHALCPQEQIILHSGESISLYFVSFLPGHCSHSADSVEYLSCPTPQREVTSNKCSGPVCHIALTSAWWSSLPCFCEQNTILTFPSFLSLHVSPTPLRQSSSLPPQLRKLQPLTSIWLPKWTILQSPPITSIPRFLIASCSRWRRLSMWFSPQRRSSGCKVS